ncbi:flagellar basal body L-ring protein FlgH [Novosphingobium capsulatum]|uniref:flagellar basal body L-ring protein FlgH n=1 Tax=Novosphingobium capsulatum TaxID=13688 RepID=UPI000ADC2646|nr:flagellar basal body L-ring protein FlgH [Novosphingobium capsulatum]WQD92957.1 flagellar basal body L-ring protein FlgH [Novosphingobium capsulatum]
MDSPFDPLFDKALHAERGRGLAPRHGLAPRQGLGLRLMAMLMVPAMITAGMLVAAQPAKARNRPAAGFDPALPVESPAKPADGSILNLANGYAGLVEGARAHAVGDSLVIVLAEQLTTSKSAASKTAKSSSFTFTPPNKGPLSILSQNGINNSGASAFSGQGNASQTSTLGGEVSVTIAQVRPNGTALVKGEKRLTLSQGQEWVQLSGIVRLADIDTTNRIQSGQVADARITYAGNGDVSRAAHQGWLTKFFNLVSPF